MTCLNQILFFYQSFDSSPFGYKLKKYLQTFGEKSWKIYLKLCLKIRERSFYALNNWLSTTKEVNVLIGNNVNWKTDISITQHNWKRFIYCLPLALQVISFSSCFSYYMNEGHCHWLEKHPNLIKNASHPSQYPFSVGVNPTCLSSCNGAFVKQPSVMFYRFLK